MVAALMQTIARLLGNAPLVASRLSWSDTEELQLARLEWLGGEKQNDESEQLDHKEQQQSISETLAHCRHQGDQGRRPGFGWLCPWHSGKAPGIH